MNNNDRIHNISKYLADKKAQPLNINTIYSVLLPLIKDNKGNLSLLYQVRSENLTTQPGEISFPGGRVEKGETPSQAAIRETIEELGISIKNIKPLGKLDFLVTPYNFAIYPYLGQLIDVSVEDINNNDNLNEIKKVFTVPLNFLINNQPEEYKINVRTKPKEDSDFPFHLIKDGHNYQWREGDYSVLFYRYQDKIIWGFTALFTYNFVEIFKEAQSLEE
ncbi:CoA pyrophosphatase [Halanaerobiaceae bacterium Z-7014]|uniref:CoA pyrophosphatase n=1 Tax=Halonatronomonas betaini TaxID=2778430 RepID=A0A931F9I0_9FIRM|nr:CoA pyrophosphatase [Halonatronomonas betaini]MBF8436484.1 CoA pyrophosphatase [Halonatronomonas betaini]